MSPRKRVRRDDPGGCSTSPATVPLQPSQAKPTSALSNLSATSSSATPTTPTPTQGTTNESVQGMPPPPTLPRLESSNKSDKSFRSNQSSRSTQEDGKPVHKTRSWYGSWPRKSGASTSVQRETILGSPLRTGSMPDFSRFDTKKSGETASLSGTSQASVNALTQLQETDPDTPTAKQDTTAPEQEPTQNEPPKIDAEHASIDGRKDSGVPPEDAPVPDASPAADTTQIPSTSSGWLGGWFSRPPAPEEKQPEAEITPQEPMESPKGPEPGPGPVAEQTQGTAGLGAAQQLLSYADPRRAASWLGLWSTNTVPEDTVGETSKAAETIPEMTEEPGETAMQDSPPANPEPVSKPSAGSTWAFWSKDIPKSSGKQPETSGQGELAVMGEGSESQPQRANSMDMDRDSLLKAEPPKDVQSEAKPSKAKTAKKKKNRPKPIEVDEMPSRPETPHSDAASVKVDSSPKSKAKTPTTATKSQNLLLPSFSSTYKMKGNPSIVQQIAALLLRAEQQQPAKHVFRTKAPPKVKKALAIGVHGLFPATYLRAMIGQPTGTSIRFANHCAEAIRRWADSHGSEDCEIEKVALEGEGKIAERVENLWKLLLNWIDHIRDADLIVVACHSQGVPVSVMLLAKLIELGIITNAKIGVCAMAGVNLGPFPDYKSSMGYLMGSAAELWEFANPESEVSQRYETSLKAILAYGVRITYVGSIDDQLVPIESAIYSPISHPYIYRAVFIDGRIHAPDFIAHLVGFACKLRNLGISDHGLIRELSVPLAGSLYGGEGHSRLYDDGQVYDLGIAHTLETTDVGNVPCVMQRHESLAPSNPYLLPWIMRGLLEEDFVKTELSAETEELLKQFDDWKPVTKALKDVKYRLEAVRSRL